MKTLKVKFSDVNSSMRLDGGFHLSEGTIYLRRLRMMPHTELRALSSNIFTAGRSKRIYTDQLFGYPYLSNTNVVKKHPLEDCKYNSKRFGYDKSSFLREGMIVTGRVGAIGQTAYVTSEMENNMAMGSDNIIRIVTKDAKISGYVYAFLVSKYGNTLLWKLATGGVQPYISEDMLFDMPIPLIKESKQQEINNLIVEASNLRTDANKILKDAIAEVESQFYFGRKEKTFAVSIKDIKKGDKYTQECRFESDFYQPSTLLIERQIQDNWNFSLLGDLCHSITISNLRARTFVRKGITLFTGQSLGLLRPDLSKQLSVKFTKNVGENTTKDGDVLVSAFGTLGKVELCFENFYTGVFASQQIARLRVDKSKIDPGYISLFLKSKVGQSLILKYKTGSVIEWANWNNFSSIKVPLPNDKGSALGDKARLVSKMHQLAYEKEKEATSIIEREIESWQ